MSESSDFTFCQVGLRVDEGNLDSPKTFMNINNMTIRDDFFGGGSANQPDTSLKKDSYADNPPSKVSGIDTYLPLKVSEILPPNSKVSKSLNDGSNVESVSGSQESKLATKRPVQRVKVPFEKGYSQMDWLKITRTHPDLAGLKGQSNRRLISMDEVKQHKSDGSIWTVLKGRVYNISAYMKFHPGGVDMLMKAAGKDCTLLFNKYHAWVNAEFLLEKCLVGVLDDSK